MIAFPGKFILIFDGSILDIYSLRRKYKLRMTEAYDGKHVGTLFVSHLASRNLLSFAPFGRFGSLAEKSGESKLENGRSTYNFCQKSWLLIHTYSQGNSLLAKLYRLNEDVIQFAYAEIASFLTTGLSDAMGVCRFQNIQRKAREERHTDRCQELSLEPGLLYGEAFIIRVRV